MTIELSAALEDLNVPTAAEVGAIDTRLGTAETTLAGLSKSSVGLGNVDNTSDAGKPVSTAQQTALNLKAPLASPTFTGTVAGVTAAMVGLGSVTNTSDASKPVSTAQQAALDLKAPLASPTFTGTVGGITAVMVGLGNVTNTSDANKPVSTAQQTALDLKAPLTSPAFTGTPTGITKAHVGLGSADNTPDTGKPVSTLQQAALDLKIATSAIDTDVTLAANSDVKVASQKAVKASIAAGTTAATKQTGWASRAAQRLTGRSFAEPLLDSVGTAPLAAYGFTKLLAAYAGQCCRVRRSSDSTELDIPFLGDGRVNVALMKRFAGSGTLFLKTFYDQSGGARDATQTTAANQPYVDLVFLRGGVPNVVLTNNTWLNLPAGVSLTSTANASVWMVLGSYSSRLSNTVFNIGTTANQFALSLSPVSAFSVQPIIAASYLNFGNPNMATIPNSNGCVIGINSAAGGYTYYRNATSYARAAVSANAVNSGTIGGSNSSEAVFQSFIVFNAALSAAEVQTLQYGLASIYETVLTPLASIVFVGDSIVASALTTGYNYNTTSALYLPHEIAVQNVGIGGQLLQTMASEVGNYVTGLFKAGMVNAAVCLGGVNDIDNGRAAAQMIADATTWAAAVKTAGFKAGMAALYARAITGGYTGPLNAIRLTFNTWVRANCGPGLTFDFLVDFDLEPTFLPTIAVADFPDNLHPGPTGYRKATPILLDAISRQLPGV